MMVDTSAQLWASTLEQLHTIAKTEGVQVEGDDNKAELVRKIREARGELELTGSDLDRAGRVRATQERLREETKRRAQRVAKRQRRR
jgi:hypothetical protein